MYAYGNNTGSELPKNLVPRKKNARGRVKSETDWYLKDHNKGHIKRPYVRLTLFDLWGFIFELKVPYFSAIMQKIVLCRNKKCLFCPEYHLLCHKNYKVDDFDCDTTCQV